MVARTATSINPAHIYQPCCLPSLFCVLVNDVDNNSLIEEVRKEVEWDSAMTTIIDDNNHRRFLPHVAVERFWAGALDRLSDVGY